MDSSVHQTGYHLDQVGVVPDVAGGGPQVDDGRRQGSRHPECVHMSHHIMADLKKITMFINTIIDIWNRMAVGRIAENS